MRCGEFITVMSDKNTVALILAIYNSDNAKMTDFLPAINHSQTLRQRLDQLGECGIITSKIVTVPARHIRITLTDKGKDIALLLSVADSFIPGELSEKSINLRYGDPVLRFMRGKEYVVQKEILSVMPYYASILKVLSRMEEEGLVSVEENTDSHREMRYSLTLLGKRIADIFEAIYEKIS